MLIIAQTPDKIIALRNLPDFSWSVSCLAEQGLSHVTTMCYSTPRGGGRAVHVGVEASRVGGPDSGAHAVKTRRVVTSGGSRRSGLSVLAHAGSTGNTVSVLHCLFSHAIRHKLFSFWYMKV